MTEKGKENTALYDRVAYRTSKFLNLLFRSLAYEHVGYLNDIIKMVGFKDEEKWIDLGCGFLQKAAKTVSYVTNIEVFGMDESKYMLKRGVDLNPMFEGMVFAGDIVRLPVRDNSVDGVFAFQSLHHLSYNDFSKSIDEIKRVLKPGGRVAIIETFDVGDNKFKKMWFRSIEREYVHISNRGLNSNTSVYYNLPKSEFVRDWEDAGFKLISKNYKGIKGIFVKVIDNIRYFISEPLVFELKE